MAASQNTKVWVWCPTEERKDKQFRHPAEIPVAGDMVEASALFIDRIRGPRTARISPVTILQAKGTSFLIAEKGATREVPRHMILPWYEGLLLLDELEAREAETGHIPASWFDQELRGLLDKERSKSQTGRLNSAIYAEKRLLNTCATGPQYVDCEERMFSYRRENIKPDDQIVLVEGEDTDGSYRVKDLSSYIPPWEAFFDQRCGFYQDFYQVKWAHPFSEIDYSSVENGCETLTGATWEPDECIPSQLDHMRLTAKRSWIKKKKRIGAEKQSSEKSSSSPPAFATVKREKPEEPQGPPAKMAKVGSHGAPLDRDILRSKVGHDFVPDSHKEVLGQIRSGWPKKAQDYPTGFAVASPPGFCYEKCDCMDDQRPQKSWETRKGWLEDSGRTSAAAAAIQAFSDQTRFVRRRGQVSRMCFFETAQTLGWDQTHARAALDLAQASEKVIRAALQQIPVSALFADADPVRVPARAFLAEDKDYVSTRFTATMAAGISTSLPQWCHVEPDDGRLVVSFQPESLELPLKVQVNFIQSEGPVGNAACVVVAERFAPSKAPWLLQTPGLVQHFSDPTRCPLERGVRAGLTEHFSELYDFTRKRPHERPLGIWLEGISRILNLLRSAAGANLAFAPTSGRAA